MDRKRENRKILTAAALAVLFLFGAGVSYLPLGLDNPWGRVYAFFGLRDFSNSADGAEMALHVLDVGHADAMLLESGGAYALIDGGNPGNGEEVCQYLARRGVRKLALVINTHPDEDHVGGLLAALRRFAAERFLAGESPEVWKEPAALSVRDELKEKGISAETVKAGDSFRLGKTELQILGPVTWENKENNNSVVIRAVCGETAALLMGDAEEEEEIDLLASGVPLQSDVLKVGHHGSATSSCKEFLQAVCPGFAAISVRRDSGNLPSREVLQRLFDGKIDVLRTDVDGTLVFSSDGVHMTAVSER